MLSHHPLLCRRTNDIRTDGGALAVNGSIDSIHVAFRGLWKVREPLPTGTLDEQVKVETPDKKTDRRQEKSLYSSVISTSSRDLVTSVTWTAGALGRSVVAVMTSLKSNAQRDAAFLPFVS